MYSKPLVAVAACVRQVGLHPFHIAGDKYLRAVAEISGALPMIVPSIRELTDLPELLEHIDGLVFPGSPSNIEPYHYQGNPSAPGTLHDPYRDAMTLPLLREAVAAGVPVLCICRGFQELNVAMGGTLHQEVHETAPYIDHREPDDDSVDVLYGLSHKVRILPGGLLERIGLAVEFEVNSLHGQGADQLAPGLRAEAVAPDGLIEAASVTGAPAFALGVQWHPEWKAQDYAPYRTIFHAFGIACGQRAESR